MAASRATAASQLHRRLFYAKWETPSQQQQQQQQRGNNDRTQDNNNDDRTEANNNNNNENNQEETTAQPQQEQQQQQQQEQLPVESDQQQQQPVVENENEDDNRVIMIFDSPTHWQEGEYERATQDQPQGDTNNNAAAAAAPPADDDADAAQQILAMERTMEAMSRRYMDNVVSQMRGTDGENGDDDRPARIMIGGLGGAMLMGGGPRVAAGPAMGPFPPDLAMAMGAAMRGGAPAIPLPRVINPPMGLFGGGPRRQNNNNNNNNNGGAGGAPNNNGGEAPNNANNNDAQQPPQGDPQQQQEQAPNPAAAAANNNNDGVPNANAPAVGEDQQQQQPNNNENNNNNNNNPPPDDGVGGIGRALGDLVRRAFRMGRPGGNGQPPRPRRRPREEPAGENGNDGNNDERPRRRARRQAGERREPAAAMMVEVRMVQGPDGRLIPLMPQMGRAGGGPNNNNNNDGNQAAPDPFHHLIADALNQAMGQMQGGPQQQQQQQGANQNQNDNNNNGQQQGANQNDNNDNNNAPQNAPPADQNNGDNNNNNDAPANPPGQGPNANNNDNNAQPNNAQNNNNNNNPHQAIGEAIAQAIRQAMMGGPPQPNNNNAAGNNNNDNNGQNNNNNGPPRGMPRPFRVNVNLRGANGNNNNNNGNNNDGNNNNNNDGPARVGFGAIPMPVFDMGQVMSSQQTHPKWTLEQLQQTLERKHHAAKTLHFDVMEGSWDSMPKEDWKQVCQKLAAALPNVTSMQVTYVEHLKDAKWAMLLSHFPNLTSLSFKHIGAMPYTFRQIGALKRLTHLSLQDDTYARSSSSGLTPVACIALAKALLKLKSLSHLTIKHLIMQDPRACWIPLLKAIRKIPTIAQLQVNGGWQQRPAGNRPGAPLICHRINLSPGNMDKMQYGPRISAARKEFLSSDEPTVANWMEAFASVGDRIDCVHYLVTQMDPSDLARAGLEGAAAMEQQPESEQKQEEAEMEIVD